MRQTCSRHNCTYLAQFRCQFWIFFRQFTSHIISYRTPYARHFKTMCQSIMHKHTTWQRKHLCLVLQSTKCWRKYQSIIITLKLCSPIMIALIIILHAKSLGCYQFIPFHICINFLSFAYKIYPLTSYPISFISRT